MLTFWLRQKKFKKIVEQSGKYQLVKSKVVAKDEQGGQGEEGREDE
jgi:hypothetical protein